MAESAATWEDKAFKKALGQILDLKKNVDPKKELRRRAKNIGMRLVKLYKLKGVNLADITKFAIKGNIKIRPKIRQAFFRKFKTIKRGKRKGQSGAMFSYEDMIKAELAARRSAKGFTSTGWFPSVKKLGGNPTRRVRAGTGPQRGKLIEKLSGFNISETLVNQQPGAARVLQKNKALGQKALDDETADMVKYISKKQLQAAQKAGMV